MPTRKSRAKNLPRLSTANLSAELCLVNSFRSVSGTCVVDVLAGALIVHGRLSTQVRFSFNLHRDPFSIGNKCRPVDFPARDHRAISFNRGAYVSAWIPIFYKRGRVVEKVINSFHACIDILQTLLGLALASQSKPEVKPRDIVVLVLSQRFFQRRPRSRIVAVQVLSSAEKTQSSLLQVGAV